MTRRKQRDRATVITEITDEARRLLDSGGAGNVTWRALTRAVGLRSPASLYTYFDSLHDLFTALILQSYERLADSIASAVAALADAPVGDRVLIGPLAYRRWAVANPGQFNLIFTDQIPGYDAPTQESTALTEIAVFHPIVETLAEAQQEEDFDPSIIDVPSHNRDLLLGLVAMFHGLTILEVNHHLDWLDAEQNFETQLRSHIARLGLPPAKPDLVERFNASNASAAQNTTDPTEQS